LKDSIGHLIHSYVWLVPCLAKWIWTE